MNDHLPNIWLMQTQRDTDGLIRVLNHEDPDVRRRAAAALRIVGDRNAQPHLQKALDSETDPDVRQFLVAALEHLLPDEDATEPATEPAAKSQPTQSRAERLVEHLVGSNEDVAVQAANALAELDDKSTVPALVMTFRNKRRTPAVRLAAAEALLRMDSAPAEVTLLSALRNEKWSLRRNGAAILGQLQAEWAVEPLTHALYDQHEMVARTARAALRRIGTPDARRALQDAKRDLFDTSDLTDSPLIQRARRIARTRVNDDVAMPQPPPEVEQIVEERRKKGTSELRLPKPKIETGRLKAPLPVSDIPPKPTEPAPANAAPTSPPPAEPTPPSNDVLDAQLEVSDPLSVMDELMDAAPEVSDPLAELFPPEEKKAPPPPDEPSLSDNRPSKPRVKSRRRRSTTQRLDGDTPLGTE